MADYSEDVNYISNENIKKVDRDLVCYPDWILRIDVGGLGIAQRGEISVGGKAPIDCSSTVEIEMERMEAIRIKVMVIEKVYDRLHGKMKELINLRYFQDINRDEVISTVRINSKRQYYNLRNRDFVSFARALGYID